MKCEKKEPVPNPHPVLETVRNRQSIRAFLKKPVPQQILVELLDTARFAPSGANIQPWKVVVVTNDLIQAIGNDIITAREANTPENPDYQYYPTEWFEPYQSRRKACGLALYSALNIAKEDKARRKEQWHKNYTFFGAPVGLFFFIDQKLEKGSWIDLGMFLQNVMIAARAFELETCPQASMAEYPDIVRKHCGIASDQHLVCGMAMGYADEKDPINQYRTKRASVDEFTTFLGF